MLQKLLRKLFPRLFEPKVYIDDYNGIAAHFETLPVAFAIQKAYGHPVFLDWKELDAFSVEGTKRKPVRILARIGAMRLRPGFTMEEFRTLGDKKIICRAEEGPGELIDSIYIYQLKYQNYDYGEVLLSLTFALIPVREVQVKFPLLNKINYPLVSVTDSIFNLKNKNLPKDLFWDTPNNNFGDKDKLAHFFGSAFISYSSNIFDFGNLIGYFVEVFEENFKIQSSIDKRDMMTNSLGNLFGKMLKENKDILPSQILIKNTLTHFRFNQ